MPDPVDPSPLPAPPPGWEKILVALKELAIVVGAVAGSIFAAAAQCQGKKNADELQVVVQKQDANAEKLSAVETEQKHTKVIATNTAMKVGAKLNGEK